MDIVEIRRILQLYYIGCLYHDERTRAIAEFRDSISEEDMAESGIEYAIEAIQNELSFTFGEYAQIASDVLNEYQQELRPESQEFRVFYREFLKTQLEVLLVIRERDYRNYSEEMAWLKGNETGLASPIFALNDANAKPLGIMQSLLETILAKEKQRQSGVASGDARREEADLRYREFDQCVLEMASNGESNMSRMANICQRRTQIDASERTLRARVKQLINN